MSRTILHPIKVIRCFPHGFENRTENIPVVSFPICTDKVRFADTSPHQNRPHSGTVIVHMNPVTNVETIPVKLRSSSAENVRDLPRDELLNMLSRPVIVGAIRNCGLHTVGTAPRAHKKVGRRLRGTVGTRRFVGRLFGQASRIIQRQIAVHLIRRNVTEANVAIPRCLQKRIGTFHIRLQERRRTRDRIVIVAFRREMHTGVVLSK